jgi:hypothetical protein
MHPSENGQKLYLNSKLGIKQRNNTHNKKAAFFALVYKYLAVKTGFASIFYLIISNLAIFLCFVPIVLIWVKKLNDQKAYLFIAIYWLANGLMNLPGWLGLSDNKLLIHHITLVYNLLDAPLLLLVFLNSTSGNNKKIIRYTLFTFIIFEVIMTLWKGYNLTSSTVIIGVGTFLAITFSIMGVIEYLQKIEHTSFENTMVFVYASFLFAYGIFIIIYFFIYLTTASKTENIDNFIIYYVSLLLSTFLTCFGFWQYAGNTKTAQSSPVGSISRF